MSLLRHWKIILSMVAIFAAGVITGGMLVIKIAKHFGYRSSPEGWAPTTFRDYQTRLKLTPDQVRKLKPIFDQAGQDLRVVRDHNSQAFWEVIRRTNEEITQHLTPEQQKRFEELKRQAFERWKHRLPPQPKQP